VSQKVVLYDSAYGNYELDPYCLVRIETYGEDFGQTSWVTTEESLASTPGRTSWKLVADREGMPCTLRKQSAAASSDWI